MAAAVRTSAAGGSSTGTADRTATITPAVGDLLVVYCCVAANTNDAPTCSDNNGGTYDLVEVMNFAIAAVNYRLSVFIRTALMVNTTSTVVTVATGSNTSGAVHVLAITGVTRTGLNAVRSTGSQNNQAAGTAAPTLNQAAFTINPVLVAHGSADTTTTPPTNWTEIQDTGFTNDTVALETAFRATGFTGTTITFGAASSTQFCSHAMELDITVLLTQSASDSVDTLVDTPALGYGNLHADSVNSLADTVQVRMSYALGVSDSVNNLADGTVKVVGVITTIADTLATLADTQAQLLGYLLALTDSAAANWIDEHRLLLAHSLALADLHVIDDAADLQLDHQSDLADSFLLSDAITAVVFPPRTPDLIFLDPGGDAVQVAGYFNVAGGSGTVSFDTAQKVVGVGSWKFESGGSNQPAHATVNNVLSDAFTTDRRVSFYFRYDSVPDTSAISAAFPASADVVYSGKLGFVNPENLSADDGVYATATPPKLGKQGSVFGNLGLDAVIPVGATIDSVKIIYQRRYDTDASSGVSVVSYRINGVTGSFFFSADEPLTDTVVTEDITADRSWTRDDLLDGVFEVIAEARRDDTDTEHTQSWDYVKVEIGFTFGGPFTETVFVGDGEAYSGEGFAGPENIVVDNDLYATAIPARNSGKGNVVRSFGFLSTIPPGAIIDSVKIIYERKYDVDTSIGISRIKYRIDGVEGPDHDNTDMPLTETVVEVDVTGDRAWERQDLVEDAPGHFEVIAEARRGDTVVEHTQSWDYVKVEVQYHTAADILWAMNASNSPLFSLGLIERDDKVGLRYAASGGNTFDSYASFSPNEWHRISFSYNILAADNLSIKVYSDGLLELDLIEMPTNGLDVAVHLRYGWIGQPGVDKSCWFDQIYVDDGSDLEDPGNVLCTAKLPATVNADNFDTTVGTGAVSERPVSLANYRQQAATAQVHQNYTLEAIDEGDVDLTGETLRGYMGWVIAKKSGFGGTFGFTLNGVTTGLVGLTTTPAFHRVVVASSNYPSDPAGIGMRSTTSSNDTFLYECGIVIAYLGPPRDDLLNLQVLEDSATTNVSDNLDLADEYTLRSEIGSSPDALVRTTIYAAGPDGSLHQQCIIESHGGEEIGYTVVAPGQEVSVRVEVSGADVEVGLTRIQE